MRLVCTVAMLTGLVAGSARADYKKVTKTVFDGHESLYAEYVRGENSRLEQWGPDGAQRSAIIFSAERGAIYRLDLNSREYLDMQDRQRPDILMSLAGLLQRRPRIRESGKTVNVYYETIDRGERRSFFGQTARHVIVQERYVAEPGACQASHDSKIDGWYIPEVGGAADVHYSTRLSGDLECHDTLVNHGQRVRLGTPLIVTTGAVRREVVQLSTEPLDSSLFIVPADFKKVDALPGQHFPSWTERLEMEWAMLARAAESWVN